MFYFMGISLQEKLHLLVFLLLAGLLGCTVFKLEERIHCKKKKKRTVLYINRVF